MVYTPKNPVLGRCAHYTMSVSNEIVCAVLAMGIIHSGILPQNQTTIQQVYKVILRSLLCLVHEKRR